MGILHRMDLKILILRKLFRHRIIGGKHTAIEYLFHGFPKHLIGEAKEIIDELVQQNIILVKPTSYGLQVSLNPEKIEEITNIIEKKL